MLELLDADEQIDRAGRHAPTPPPVRGRVVFDDVHFSYDPDRPLIEGLVARRRAGPDGRHRRPDRRRQDHARQPASCGSTSSTAGRITLDGRDIASIPRHELRSEIGMVLQDTWLFGGTIRDNIAYGNPDATEEQILRGGHASPTSTASCTRCPTATTR